LFSFFSQTLKNKQTTQATQVKTMEGSSSQSSQSSQVPSSFVSSQGPPLASGSVAHPIWIEATQRPTSVMTHMMTVQEYKSKKRIRQKQHQIQVQGLENKIDRLRRKRDRLEETLGDQLARRNKTIRSLRSQNQKLISLNRSLNIKLSKKRELLRNFNCEYSQEEDAESKEESDDLADEDFVVGSEDDEDEEDLKPPPAKRFKTQPQDPKKKKTAEPITVIDLDEEVTKNVEELLVELGLPYHVVINCGGDLGLGQVKKYDIEVWVPSHEKYRETHSASYFHDFQTRRLNIRYKDTDGKMRYVHSLNNTAVATPRILIAILENNQQEDGTIKIPEPLVKYMGKEYIGK
jgi:seryl-tRNA synthetase